MLLRSTASINGVVLGWLFPFLAVVLDAFAGLSRRFRPLPRPRNLGFASLFVGISFTIEMKVPLLTTPLAFGSVELRPTMPSADFCRPLALSTLLSPAVFFLALADRQISRVMPSLSRL